MQIPQDLQPHFIHTALVVSSNHVGAACYLVDNGELSELAGVSAPREKKSDREGFFISSDSARHSGPASDQNRGERDRFDHFIKQLATHLENLVREHGVTYVHLAMPAEVHHALTAHLHGDVKQKITRVVEHDLMNLPPLEVLRRLYA